MAAGAGARDHARRQAFGAQSRDHLGRLGGLDFALALTLREIGGVLQIARVGLHAAERQAVGAGNTARHGERLFRAGAAGALPPDPDVDQHDEPAVCAGDGGGQRVDRGDAVGHHHQPFRPIEQRAQAPELGAAW